MPDPPLPPVPPWEKSHAGETPGLRGLLTLAVLVVAVAALAIGRAVLMPVTLAILLSFLLAPLVNLLRRIRLGHIPSVILAVAVSVAIILLLGGLIGTQIADIATALPRYQTTIQRKIDVVRGATIERLQELVARVAHDLETPAGILPSPATPAAPQHPTTAHGPPPVPVELHQPLPSPLDLAESVVSPLLGPLATAGIVFVVAIFILLQKEDLRDRVIRLFGSSDLQRTTVAMDDAARRLSRYFLSELGVNAAFGTTIGIGLFLIGIPSPALWAVVAMLLRFVPYIGTWMAAFFPVALGAAVHPGWSAAIEAFALFLAVELVTGQVVEPTLYGRSTGLSPLAVIVAAIFWGWIWGLVGIIVSTPISLCLVVLGRHIERLEFLDILLGDRPVLTPVEHFYQRMLAGNPDEALEQAEDLLKERSLSSYYDEVALKGLQLASRDTLRGTLSSTRLERIKEAVRDLVEGLDEAEDVDPAQGIAGSRHDIAGLGTAEQHLPKQPAPKRLPAEGDDQAADWRNENSVLCIAGRGPFDETVSRMLTQLLVKAGFKARAVAHAEASRAGIATLATADVAIICVMYTELGANLSSLRYLLQRLRRKAPQASFVIGLSSAEELADNERLGDLRRALGAERTVTSLRDAVNACVDLATTMRRAHTEADGSGRTAPLPIAPAGLAF